MTELFWAGFEMFSNFWDQFLFLYLIEHQLPDKQLNIGKKALAWVILGSTLTAMQRFGLPQMIIFSCMFLLHLIYCLLWRQGQLWQRILWAVVTRSAYYCNNQLVMFLMMNIPEFNLPALAKHTPQRFLAVCIYMFFSTMVFYLLSRISPRNRTLPLPMQLISVFMAFLCALFAGTIFDLSPAVMEQEGAWLLSIVTVGFMIMSVAWLFILDVLASRNAEFFILQMEHQRIESEHQYAEGLQSLYEHLRDIRHDTKHQILALLGLVKQADLSKLEAHLLQLQSEVEPDDVRTLTQFPQIDAILSVKLQQAKRLNIRTDVLFTVPSTLPMNIVDLCSILGNILDNALEAARKVPEEQRYIRIHAVPANNMWKIKIINSSNGEYKYNPEEKLLTTKQGAWHGRGLRRIQQLVEQNEGDVFIEAGANTFTVDVLLPCS